MGFFCSSYTVENDKEGIGSNFKKKKELKSDDTQKYVVTKMNPLWFHFPPRCGDAAVCSCSHAVQSQLYPKRQSWCLWNAARKLNPAACIAMQPATQSAYEFLRVISIILSYCLHLWPLTIKLVQPWEVHEAGEHFNVALRFRGLSQDIFSGAECKQSADSLTGSSFFFLETCINLASKSTYFD